MNHLVSNDNRIRVWEIPEGGIEEDVAEPKFTLEGKLEKETMIKRAWY